MSLNNIIPLRLELFGRVIGATMGLITNRLNSLKDLFRVNGVASTPSDATYNALSPGYTTMQLRRTFGSKKRAFNAGIIRARATNSAPTVPTLTNQTGAPGGILTYVMPAFGDVDTNQTLTYTVTGLPVWLSFTPGTRTFTGTRQAGTSTVVVTATDNFGASATGQFTVTIA